MAAQPLDRRLRQVRLHHHQIGMVDIIQPLPQELRRDVLIDGHVVHGQGHVAVAAVDKQIGARPAAGNGGAVAQVKAHRLGKAILPQHGDHGHLLTQQAEVVGDVPSHAAQRGGHPAGVGVPGHQRRVGHRADIHIHAAHHGDVGRLTQQIAAAGNVTLPHQVGNVDRGAGPRNTGLVGQLLLGNTRVFPYPLQQLPFSSGHTATS